MHGLNRARCAGLGWSPGSAAPPPAPPLCGQGPPPGLACSSLTRRTRQASSLHTPLPLSPAHARVDTLTCTHLLNSGSDGLHADGTNEAQTCRGDTGSHQLFVIEPKAAPSSQGLNQHPAVPRDPRGCQGLCPKWPRRLTLPLESGHRMVANGATVGSPLDTL